MHTDPAASVRRLSLAACAVAVAASVGGVQAAEHEDASLTQIEKYCTTSWRNAGVDQQDWDDCTQQVLTELLERLPRRRLPAAIDQRESTERRELNRTIWRIAQRWRRAARPVSLDNAPPQLAAPDASTDKQEEFQLAMTVATECLSSRQQRILSLWCDGHSISEIAEQLDLTPARASDEKYKAIRKLRQRLETIA